MICKYRVGQSTGYLQNSEGGINLVTQQHLPAIAVNHWKHVYFSTRAVTPGKEEKEFSRITFSLQ